MTTKITTEEARSATNNAMGRRVLIGGMVLAIVCMSGALWFYTT